MATIHFLNVKHGDCSIIQHNSSRVTVIDVSNASPVQYEPQSIASALNYQSPVRHVSTPIAWAFSSLLDTPHGNFKQKEHPVNPIKYLKDCGVERVFRYIQTHPDMDHMDGISDFFEVFRPLNFWDTDNNKKLTSSELSKSPYSEQDWHFYKKLRSGHADPKRLVLTSGAEGQFWNRDERGNSGSDDLYILSPTAELTRRANQLNDYNDCSYVILYRSENKRIVFGGDSHDQTWKHILSAHQSDVTDIDLLIAPHHGRASGRSYEFLNVLKPKLTFFGNAQSEHMAYSAWRNRGLKFITNNQANCMIVDVKRGRLDVYVTNETFARYYNSTGVRHSDTLKAWFICSV